VSEVADPEGPPIRVVLVDDHRMLREGLRSSLEEFGIDVVAEASDGDEGARVVLDLRPDVTLMDVTMPVLTGIEATRRIREGWPEARIVILTMHADQDVVADAIRSGASGYLTKDCSTEEVVQALRLAADGDTALSIDIAASMLNEVHRLAPTPGADPDSLITKREEEVLQLIADGLSTTEVAARLYISVKTVKNHLASIYQKLDSRDRTQAVLRAVRMGIVRLDYPS
jgi:two-component system, NarL family, response regulator DegU